MSDTIGAIAPGGALSAVKISGVSTVSDLTPLCAPWCELEDVRACPDRLACASDEQALDAIEIASYLLWLLSEKRFPGICEATVRPCSASWPETLHSRPDFAWDGGWAGGFWSTSWGWARPWGWCCNASHTEGSCGCGSGPSKVLLGHWPIREIISVEIDGSVLDPSEYEILDRRWLIRMADADGNSQGWPCCQRLDRQLGEDDTFGVTFKFGTAPPLVGKRACAAYAAQWARACASDDSCSLPPGIQSIARGGTRYDFIDPTVLAANGMTGVPEVDRWLAAERFGQKRQPAVFINPDDFAPAHTTGLSGITFT